MNAPANIPIITADALVDRVRAFRDGGHRLVQIAASRLSDSIELIYSFDLDGKLENLRLLVPLDNLRVPSICSIYKCVLLYENEIHDLFGIQVDGMAVDFHGNLYNTAIKYPLGSLKTACAKPDRAKESAQPAADKPQPAAKTN